MLWRKLVTPDVPFSNGLDLAVGGMLGSMSQIPLGSRATRRRPAYTVVQEAPEETITTARFVPAIPPARASWEGVFRFARSVSRGCWREEWPTSCEGTLFPGSMAGYLVGYGSIWGTPAVAPRRPVSRIRRLLLLIIALPLAITPRKAGSSAHVGLSSENIAARQARPSLTPPKNWQINHPSSVEVPGPHRHRSRHVSTQPSSRSLSKVGSKLSTICIGWSGSG
jgi:hypothetical protein